MALTQAQIAQAAAQLEAQGAYDLAALVRKGGALGNQLCQSLGFVQPAGTMVPALPPSSTVPSVPTPPSGNGSSCGCGPKPGTPSVPNGVPNIPGGPQQPPNNACGIAVPPGPGPSTPIPISQQIGSWNCIAVTPDLAPCEIAKIQREEKLPTVTGELTGALLPAGTEIGVLFAPIDVSHQLCIDYVRVSVTDAEDVTTTISIPVVSLQGEILVQNPDGTFAHAWQYRDPERPDYLGITDGRCRCETLCVCISAYAHGRLVFELPSAVAADATLTVEVWGRRKDWMTTCGPCGPCLICDHELLTTAEENATTNTVYELA